MVDPRYVLALIAFLPSALPAWAWEDPAPAMEEATPLIEMQRVEADAWAAYPQRDISRIYRWMDERRPEADETTVGYRWNRFRFERTAAGTFRPADTPRHADIQHYKARISRLSFRPAENLRMQLVRGRVSGLDYLVGDESLRRTAVSASYAARFDRTRVETTFAWGRSSRKLRESTSGFLLESTASIGGVHTLFGRLERVGSDELGRNDDGAPHPWFKLNRLTFGYFRDLDLGSGSRAQVGGFISRYMVPAAHSERQGDPSMLMTFVRFRLQ